MVIFQPCKLLHKAEKETMYSNGGSAAAPLQFYELHVRGGRSSVSVLFRQEFLKHNKWLTTLCFGREGCSAIWTQIPTKHVLPQHHHLVSVSRHQCSVWAAEPQIERHLHAGGKPHALIWCFRVKFLLHSVLFIFVWSSSRGSDQSVSLWGFLCLFF